MSESGKDIYPLLAVCLSTTSSSRLESLGQDVVRAGLDHPRLGKKTEHSPNQVSVKNLGRHKKTEGDKKRIYSLLFKERKKEMGKNRNRYFLPPLDFRFPSSSESSLFTRL
jgi:hypothetical protein